ncbi:hypothetical protein G9A89_000249, partial [Geosiphon pyriformis]
GPWHILPIRPITHTTPYPYQIPYAQYPISTIGTTNIPPSTIGTLLLSIPDVPK